MPEFHDTQMGRKFYDYQLPALIKAIQENTAAINKLVDEKQKANRLLSNDRERREQ